MTANGGTQSTAIRGVAMAVPERRVTNAEIASQLDVDPAWIVKRTGTSERPWALPGDDSHTRPR